MCTSALGKIINPIGAIAPKSGVGQWLDPAGAIGRKVGGTAGKIIDPAGTVRDMQKQQAVQQQPQYAVEETVLTQKKALAKKDDL
jgi:hypothetical protein